MFKGSNVFRAFSMSMYERENDDEVEGSSTFIRRSSFSRNFDKYANKRRHLVEKSVLNSIEYQRTLSTHEAEDFAKQHAKVVDRLAKKHAVKRLARAAVPHIFVEPIQKPDLQYKKGTSRRKRGLTEREAADVAKAYARQRQRAIANNAEQTQAHESLMQREARAIQKGKEKEVPIDEGGFSHVNDLLKSNEESSKMSFDISQNRSFEEGVQGKIYTESDSDDEKSVRYGRFSPDSPLSETPLSETFLPENTSEAPLCISDSFISFSDINIDSNAVASVLKAKAARPSAATASAALSAQRLSQIPHSSKGFIGRQRKKSKQQLAVESQERFEAQKKVDAKVKKEAAKMKKQAKFMKPRTENVSQLADQLNLLSSSL